MILATYGGGTNSSAAIIEFVKKGLPLDIILCLDKKLYEPVRK